MVVNLLLSAIFCYFAQYIPRSCINGQVIPEGMEASFQLKKPGIGVRNASFSLSQDGQFIEIYHGWATFTTDAEIRVDDLIVIEVKVTPSKIMLIVEVVTDKDIESDNEEVEASYETSSVVDQNFGDRSETSVVHQNF